MIKTFIISLLSAFGLLGFFGGNLGSVPANAIQTNNSRILTLKEEVKNIPLDAASVILPNTDYYNRATEQLRGRNLTGYEYQQIKDNLKGKISNRNNIKPTYEEFATWAEIANKSIKNCVLKNVDKNNLIDSINNNCL